MNKILSRSITLGITALVFLAGCGNRKPTEHALVSPLPAKLSLAAVMDSEYSASLSIHDIDCEGKLVSFTICSEDKYDSVTVSKMHIGDTLVFNHDTLLVSKIVEKDGFIEFFGSDEQKTALLKPYKKGMYRAVLENDHSAYSEVLKMTLPMSSFFTIIDCGENPIDTARVIVRNHAYYLHNLPDERQEFSCLNTTVLVDNAHVTHIIRKYMPE